MSLNILSLGAGVQSTTVFLMSVRGVLPKLDHAIFADTGWEPPAVYRHLEWIEGVARAAGITVHRVSAGNLREAGIAAVVRGSGERGFFRAGSGVRWASMPLYTRLSDGSIGMIRRQCTTEYKIAPIQRKIRELANIAPRSRPKNVLVRQWFGISWDELRRMRDSQTRWIEHYYPLVDGHLARQGCLVWLERCGYPRPPRSACIGCPFHHDDEWRAIKSDPAMWADACEFDDAIRNSGGMRGQMFLHRSCKPLREVDLRTDSERGQGTLWDMECAGMCGV